MTRFVTFGEVMLRLAPPGFRRLSQELPGTLEATFGGAELNVAVAIAVQGGTASFLTAVPDNPVTDALEREMRRLGVGTELLRRRNHGRFGAYFVETGANQRGGTVTYDRDHTAIATTPAGEYDFEAAFANADWLHVTGITPSLSAAAAEAVAEAVRVAKSREMTVSCDLNFRKKLWRWEEGTEPVDLARKTMRALIPQIDVVVGNEEDADLALGIAAEGTHVASGRLNRDGYRDVAARIVEAFPNVARVAITLRESVSASHNDWGAMLFDAQTETAHFAPTDANGEYRPYEIRNIVDRVGAGDSFAGSLLFALTTEGLSDPETALRYAVAGSCLKHSVVGDFAHVSRGEIEKLMHGSGSGRVER